MNTKVSDNICYQCGCHLHNRTGAVCSKCFNASFVPVPCKLCNQMTLVKDREKNEHITCFRCDINNPCTLTCNSCNQMINDAAYSSQFHETYKCKSCCNKSNATCKECGLTFWSYNGHPLCKDCQLKNYRPLICIGCGYPKYFHKLRKPSTCICNRCYSTKKGE
jgi:hypothetical protein